MTKSTLLAELARFKQDRIRGLLIELDLAEKLDLYEPLRQLVQDTIEAHRSPFIDSLDWDVGDSRFKPDFLVHLFHDDLHEKHLGAGDVSDLARVHSDAELAELLAVMTSLLENIAALGIDGMKLNPTLYEP
ncbi:MAG: hypothetical protein HY22_14070 [[Candidatus Thermochlorobacteriaceae] bacterium GBChlB]|jgi:hypothetical protein|nr:MAG: hypothetical protein HY22_14070 [[Candidatus Thermochlorobacteriaceae] bacterium GBChlB]